MSATCTSAATSRCWRGRLRRYASRQPAWAALGLVLAGVDRGTGAELERLSASSGGPVPLVTFAGAAPEPLLLALYRSAAALVYPSRYEGFGLPLLEAMACGTPVIAARTSSIPEVVGDAAVLLDPDDEEAWIAAIERVLEDAPHRARLRDAGLSRAREFSWRRTAEETARVYRELLNSRLVTPRISVIVLNYNGRAWLEPCLAALAAQAGAPPFETLLVDNGSTDGSMALVAARFPSVRIVDNGRNLGFAGGNNAGARAARGDTLVFLNNDTIPAADWLARLHAASLEAPGPDTRHVADRLSRSSGRHRQRRRRLSARGRRIQARPRRLYLRVYDFARSVWRLRRRVS